MTVRKPLKLENGQKIVIGTKSSGEPIFVTVTGKGVPLFREFPPQAIVDTAELIWPLSIPEDADVEVMEP